MNTRRAHQHDLSIEECLALLAAQRVGRLCVIDGDWPVALPVNYRAGFVDQGLVIVVRARPGSAFDRSGPRVSFEIDGIDVVGESGWSVLVRGNLHHLHAPTPSALRLVDHAATLPDPRPLLDDRTEWLVINPIAITGRRTASTNGFEVEWAYALEGYL